MPYGFQLFAKALPVYHYLRTSRAIYLTGAGAVRSPGHLAVIAAYLVVLGAHPAAPPGAGTPHVRTLATILAVARQGVDGAVARPHHRRGIHAVQPVILTACSGYAVRSEVHDAHWVVFDADRTATSRRLVDELVGHLQARRRHSRWRAMPRPSARCAAARAPPAWSSRSDFTRALVRGEPAPAQLLRTAPTHWSRSVVAAVVREVTSRFRADDDRRAREDR